MSCNCGPILVNINGTSGAVIGGSANFKTNPVSETGGGGMLAGGSASVSVPTNVYDGYAFYYHLKEQGNGTANEYANSEGYLGGQGDSGNNILHVPQQVDGIYYKANSFKGAHYITCPNDSIPNDSPMTVTLWAKIDNPYQQRVFFSRGQSNTASGDGWSLQLGHTLGRQLYATLQLHGTNVWVKRTVTGSTILNDGCWYHLALVWQPGIAATLYVDGVQDGQLSISETKLVGSTAGHFIGRVDSYQYAYATLQEVSLSPIARDAAWIKADHDNLCVVGFYTVASEEDLLYTVS